MDSPGTQNSTATDELQNYTQIRKRAAKRIKAMESYSYERKDED